MAVINLNMVDGWIITLSKAIIIFNKYLFNFQTVTNAVWLQI